MNNRPLLAEVSAEFFGTFILIAFGCGSVAAGLLLGVMDFFFQVSFAWALAVAFAIYAVGGISGAHINPAVTLALAVHRKFAWNKVLPYMAAQIAGAFAGAATVYFLYRSAFLEFESNESIIRGTTASLASAKVFSTYPQPYLTTFGAFFSEFLLTALLIVIVFSCIDDRNLAPKGNLAPLIIGLGVGAIGMSFGAQTGFAINPARDFGPKLFAFLAGWKSIALPAPNYYFWIPIVGPLLGGVFGGWLYDVFVGNFLKERT